VQALGVPIDAQMNVSRTGQKLSALFSSMIFRCGYPTCVDMNAIDALKLYVFSKNMRSDAITTTSLSLPLSQSDMNTTIPSLFIDERLYQEALSVAIVNSSGEAGLGNQLGRVLTNIGANVISISTGEVQPVTAIQTTQGTTSYSIQRFQEVLDIQPQQVHMHSIADVVITIGQKHPNF